MSTTNVIQGQSPISEFQITDSTELPDQIILDLTLIIN